MDRSKIPEFVKMIYREGYYVYNRVKGKIIKLIVYISPELHARYDLVNLHLPHISLKQSNYKMY